ncbi:KilA-N domain-containing protein [Pantoea ananatis]|uniref:KilA-N domain-containing protein n=1 Tax=Pantoea ananas TaxID=553 RepID=UPI0011A19C56|nr:KilA-N domain-containing protein [Pantoea ananatis]
MTHVKHKHADHIIIIEDHAFKANADGMWNLTEIWRVLGLPNNKLPSQWRGKITKRLADMQKMHVEKIGIESITYATKQAALKYAGWVSEDFEDAVYSAFEAILEMPEVAAVVANKMVELGDRRSAEIIERMATNADRDYAHDEMRKWREPTTNKKLHLAVLNGHLTLAQAVTQGLKGIWLKRCSAAIDAVASAR